jgi:ABC-type oligopeptide transport system substrate-binding subunit
VHLETPEIDEMIHAMTLELDKEKRYELIRQFGQYISRDKLYLMPMLSYNGIWGINPDKVAEWSPLRIIELTRTETIVGK